MRKFLILAVFTLKLLVANSQVDSVKSIITTKTIGQFLITTHDSIEVLVKVDKVKYFDKQKFNFDEADVSIRIEDKNGKAYYFRNLSTIENELNDIKSIDLPGVGKALILVYDQFPCYGTGCCSFQIFGFNGLGYFVPFTGIIDLGLSGNAEMVANFKLKWMDNHGNEVPASKNKEPKALYTIPNTLGDYKLVIFKLNTKVKLIDMKVNSESWIHLEIDGVEGYMTYSDFSMSGFSLCD